MGRKKIHELDTELGATNIQVPDNIQKLIVSLH